MPFLFKPMASSGKTMDNDGDDEPSTYKVHKKPTTKIESDKKKNEGNGKASIGPPFKDVFSLPPGKSFTVVFLPVIVQFLLT